MKKQILTTALVALLCAAQLAPAQTPAGAQQQAPPPAGQQQQIAAITPNRVFGTVTVINLEAKGMSVKTDAGQSVLVMFDDKTVFMRARPGASTLEGATTVTLSDVGVGDRVIALGRVSEDQKSVPARRVVVMTKADIAQKHERDREEWRRRGIFGVVKALNAQAQEITIETRTREGLKQVVIPVTDKVTLRRYAPDSVKFADAKPSAFAELKVGDQLRALGERSADGARFTPEEVVTGSFRTVLGTVTAVDAANNVITAKNEQAKQTFTVSVTPDSNLRRLPQFGGAGGGGMMIMRGGTPGQTPPGGAEGNRRPQGAGGQQGGAPGEGGQRRMMMGGGFDIQQMIERLPQVSVAELKPGDVIIVSSTQGADPARVTAITLLAGADALIAMMNAQQGAQQRPAAGPSLSSGLPAGIDIGIGLP